MKINQYENTKYMEGTKKKGFNHKADTVYRNVRFGNLYTIPMYTMDFITRGGLCATFCTQDFFGMVLPRTLTGLQRNKDITGEYNYGEAAEVGIREILTGPPILMIPMIMLYVCKKLFGKACDIPAEKVKVLGKLFHNFIEKLPKECTNIKRAFYKDVVENILLQANPQLSEDDLNKKVNDFVTQIIDIENSKPKTLLQNLRKTNIPGSSNEKLDILRNLFIKINKNISDNPSADFTAAKIECDNQISVINFDKLLDYLNKFTDTIIGKHKNKPFTVESVNQFVKRITLVRYMIVPAILATVATFCYKIPDLYQLSETNPGLKGLNTNKNNEISGLIKTEEVIS